MDTYIGVDVGGTKILAALVRENGTICARERCPTPRDCSPPQTLDAILSAICGVTRGAKDFGKAKAIGLAIPGVVDPDTGVVIDTPNLNLTGMKIVREIRKSIDLPVVLGNDVNMGTLGEKWLGPTRKARSMVGIFIGTGIGGGIFSEGKLLRGCRETAGEIGHMIMQIGGPRCGCGGSGCYEALASRTAIERDVRAALSTGRKSIVTDLMEDKSDLLKSSTLAKALKKKDSLVTEVMTRASEVTGYACLSVRHLLDPEAIVLGGGVIEACGWFMYPLIRKIVDSDPLGAASKRGEILLSVLGDDSVALGTVALALESLGKSPFQQSLVSSDGPAIERLKDGSFRAGDEILTNDFYMRVNGKIKSIRKWVNPDSAGSNPKQIPPKILEKVLRGGPSHLFIGSEGKVKAELSREAEEFLRYRGIRVELGVAQDILEACKRSTDRKALLIVREPESNRP